MLVPQAPLERGSLEPVQLVLVGLLEDARIEWLAARELPGLRALWLGFHTAGPNSGNGFEMLLQRLARGLLDAGHDDPHPWVQKGRRIFFGDARRGTLAVAEPGELRRAASLLGNDVGPMRLQFNAKLYRVEPAYRDDNSHLWIDEPEAVDASAPRTRPADLPARGARPRFDGALDPDRRVGLDWPAGEAPARSAPAGTLPRDRQPPCSTRPGSRRCSPPRQSTEPGTAAR